MSQVNVVRTTTQGQFLYYNLTDAVGPGALNRRSDVLLVQYLLREVYKSPAARPPTKPPGAAIQVTGTADQATFAHILHYQQSLKSGGRNVATDGRIDPARGDQSRGSISGTQYTILFLNLSFKKARPVSKLEDEVFAF